MKVLLKNVTVFAPSSPLHGKNKDILIDKGILTKTGAQLKVSADKIIEAEGLWVSPGWMDCFADFCDPGNEHKETLETGAAAAAAGGFTDVMIVPDTRPVVHHKSQVEYITRKSHPLAVNIHPIGAITKNAEGKELSEMYDMFHSGAVAFSDGFTAVQSPGILQKGLEYLLAINGIIIQLPDDRTIGTHGLMNEGEVSLRMGLQGKPALAEELMVARDIELTRYTGSKIHFTGISTAKSLSLIAAAKKEKLAVTCSVSPYHLFFSDEDIRDYDTNLKVNPPLRTKKDRDALRKGIRSGTIDFIASHHRPQDWDHKACEFQYAGYGMETLESVFGAALASGITPEEFIRMQTENIRSIFGMPVPVVEEGAPAVLTLFVPHAEYIFEEAHIFSKSRNNAFTGKKLKGKVFGIINKEKLFLNK